MKISVFFKFVCPQPPQSGAKLRSIFWVSLVRTTRTTGNILYIIEHPLLSAIYSSSVVCKLEAHLKYFLFSTRLIVIIGIWYNKNLIHNYGRIGTIEKCILQYVSTSTHHMYLFIFSVVILIVSKIDCKIFFDPAIGNTSKSHVVFCQIEKQFMFPLSYRGHLVFSFIEFVCLHEITLNSISFISFQMAHNCEEK